MNKVLSFLVLIGLALGLVFVLMVGRRAVPGGWAAGAKLTGTVVDTAGKPAPNVAVILFPFSQGGQTDSQGRFVVEYKPSQFGGAANFQRVVIARDPGRNLAAALEIEDSATNASVRLEPALALSGRVTDPDGKPITNAEATVMFMTERMGTQLGSAARVDARGRFAIHCLPPGRRYSVTLSADGFGRDAKNVEATEASRSPVEIETFTLPPANLPIAGVVVDADDKPVAGAMLTGYGEKQPSLQGRADAHGHFTFDHVCPGAITLSANGPLGGQMGSVSAEGGDTNITIELGSQQASFGQDNAGLPHRIRGLVLDADGKPAARVAVNLFPDFSNTQKKTDEAGRFRLTFNPNQFGGGNSRPVIIARDLNRHLAVAVELDEDATNAEVRLEPGLTIAGRVTDPDGKSISGAEATLMFWSERMGVSFGSPTKADDQGRFQIVGLPQSRRYGVSVSAKGFGQDNKNLDADTATNRVELETFQLMPASLRIAGVVLNADDKPVARAMVNTMGNDKQPQLNGQTDAKGRFSFDHVCAGPIRIMANGVGGYGNVSAEGGDTNITIQFGSQQANFGSGVRPRQKINGVVLDADGKPAAKVAVSVFPDFSNTQKKTDEAGRFLLSFDPNQFGGGSGAQRVILARDLEHNLAASQDLEGDATNATLRLAPGFTLVGHAADVNGKPLAKAQATLMFRASRMSSQLGQSLRANAEGQFEIKGLPAGRGFTVTVTAPGYGQDSHNADTGEGENRRVELDPFQLLIADQRIAGVVVDADDKPVRGAWVNCYGQKQNGQNLQADSKGRFSLDKICVGSVSISANDQGGGFANAEAEAGDTNITLHLGASGRRDVSGRKPAALRGKPLPDLAAAGLDAADAADHPVLALLIDAEQRPCRSVLRLLSDHAAILKQKGVAVIVLHSGDMAEDAFNAWKQDAAAPFPIMRLKQEPGKARAAWGAGALPWFILTDKSHVVIAEGFTLDDLDAKLGEIK